MTTKSLIAKDCSWDLGINCQGSLQGLVVYFKKIHEDGSQLMYHSKAGKFELVKMNRLIWGQFLCTRNLHLNPVEVTPNYKVSCPPKRLCRGIGFTTHTNTFNVLLSFDRLSRSMSSKAKCIGLHYFMHAWQQEPTTQG